MSASAQSPISVYTPLTAIGSQSDGPTWAAVPADAPGTRAGLEALGDRLRDPERPDIKPRKMLDVSPPTTSTRVASTPLRGPKMPLTAAKPPRPAPPLQSLFPGPNVIETPLPRACRCHSPRLAMSLPSGTHPFQKCSLSTSCRGAIYPRFGYEITTLYALLRNSNSCTPPILRWRGRKKESL